MRHYPRAQNYPDLDQIYSQCSGPDALRTAEFVADAMGLRSDWRLIDIGMFRGGQTCSLAREYGCQMVGVPDLKFAGSSFDAAYSTTA